MVGIRDDISGNYQRLSRTDRRPFEGRTFICCRKRTSTENSIVKLIFDQNISYRVIKLISDSFSESIHVTKAGLTDSTDLEIWTYAKRYGYSIVTFDADFLNLATLNGCPPKIILLKMGNRRTNQIAQIIISNKDLMAEFLRNDYYGDIACLEITA